MFSFEDITESYFTENTTFDTMSDSNDLSDNDYQIMASNLYPSSTYSSEGANIATTTTSAGTALSTSSSLNGSPYDATTTTATTANNNGNGMYTYPSGYYSNSMTSQNMGAFAMDTYNQMHTFGDCINQVGMSHSNMFVNANPLSSGLPPINNDDSNINNNFQSQQQQQQQPIQSQPQHGYSMFGNYRHQNGNRMISHMNNNIQQQQRQQSFSDDYGLVSKIPRLQSATPSSVIANTNANMAMNTYVQRVLPQPSTTIKSSPTLTIPTIPITATTATTSLSPQPQSQSSLSSQPQPTTTIMPVSSLPPLLMPSQSPQQSLAHSSPLTQLPSTSSPHSSSPLTTLTSQQQQQQPITTQPQQHLPIVGGLHTKPSYDVISHSGSTTIAINSSNDNNDVSDSDDDDNVNNDTNEDDTPIKITDSNNDDVSKDSTRPLPQQQHMKRPLVKNGAGSSSSNTLSSDALILVKGPTKPAVPGEEIPSNAPPFILKGLPPPAIFGGKMPHVSRRSRKRPKKEPTEDMPEDEDSDVDSPERLAVRLPRETLLNITSTDMMKYVKYLRENYVLSIGQEKELKHQKRLVKNRESARNSRQKKQDQIVDLQAEIEVLKREISDLKEQNSTLLQENIALKAAVHKGCGGELGNGSADNARDADPEANSKKTAGKAFRLTGILIFAVLLSFGAILDMRTTNTGGFALEKRYRHEHIPHVVAPGVSQSTGRAAFSYTDKVGLSAKPVYEPSVVQSHAVLEDQGDNCSNFNIKSAFNIKEPLWNPENYSYVVIDSAKQIYPEGFNVEFGSKYLGVILPVSTFCPPADSVGGSCKTKPFYITSRDDMIGLTCRVIDGSFIPDKSPLLKKKQKKLS